jgi:hypothetical protein
MVMQYWQRRESASSACSRLGEGLGPKSTEAVTGFDSGDPSVPLGREGTVVGIIESSRAGKHFWKFSGISNEVRSGSPQKLLLKML